MNQKLIKKSRVVRAGYLILTMGLLFLSSVVCSLGSNGDARGSDFEAQDNRNLESTIAAQQATIEAQEDEIDLEIGTVGDVPDSIPDRAIEAWERACCSYITDVTYEFIWFQKASTPQEADSRWIEVWCVVVESNVHDLEGPVILVGWDDGDWTATGRYIRPGSKHRDEWMALGCPLPPGYE